MNKSLCLAKGIFSSSCWRTIPHYTGCPEKNGAQKHHVNLCRSTTLWNKLL